MKMGIVEQITHEVGEKFGLSLDDNMTTRKASLWVVLNLVFN